MSINRGSEWGKWDLHVHTPLSFESQFGMSSVEREEYDPISELNDIDTPERYDSQLWAKYIDELEGIDHVDCLGITDYFSLEGYELVETLRNNGYLNNFDFVLPNIEFRLDTITGNGKRINLHVIFSNDLSVDDIREEFLRNLKIRLDEGNEMTLRPDSLRRLGSRAKERFGDDCSDYIAGCKYARVKFDNIIDELNSTNIFEGKYLMLLSGAEWHEINWSGQDADKKRQLLATNHGLFSNQPADLSWATGQADLSPEEFRDTFGSLKPVFSGSDSHDFASLCEPNEQRYCWLKADHNFEGLKQVVFEPRDRVHIGSSKPESFTQIQTIRSLSITNGDVNPELSIDEVDIPFNSNLITIIGSQGSGKTALLDFVANCFQDRRDDAVDDDNSFIARIEDSNPSIQTEIEFEGDDIEPFSKEVLDSDLVEGPDISYIPQGKIVEFCEEGNRLHDQIKNLVTNAVDKEASDAVEEFDSQWEQIDGLTDELRRLNAKLHDINPPEVKAELAEEQSRLSKTKTLLENKKSEIEDFKENHKKQLEETEAEELQNKIDEFRKRAEQLSDLGDLIQSAISDLEAVDSFNNQINEISSRCESFDLDPAVQKIELDDQRESLESLLEKVENKQSAISGEIEGIRDQMDELSEVDEELSELREEQRRIEDKITQIKESIGALKSDVETIDKLRSERKNTFVEYVSTYLDQREKYREITNEFADGDGDILGDVEFNPLVEVTENRIEEFTGLLDLRSVNVGDVKDGLHRLRQIIRNDRPEEFEDSVMDYIDTMENLREETVSGVEPIEFDGLLYDDCLTLSEEVEYQGVPMSQLSRGQKGTVLLKIYLAKGENPLIIDSPEDNLDNRFVYDELIDAVRKAKSNRQIFIATHDANLVVNTDSEQVIITNFSEGRIEYDAGALEEEDIRSEAKAILEGGDEAFRRREEKYELSPK
jgi:ABC-type cobalamin/Fe3+-siderophores transport system ATPase subunit/uncharacterized coiled-coil DUF342 family protein